MVVMSKKNVIQIYRHYRTFSLKYKVGILDVTQGEKSACVLYTKILSVS